MDVRACEFAAGMNNNNTPLQHAVAKCSRNTPSQRAVTTRHRNTQSQHAGQASSTISLREVGSHIFKQAVMYHEVTRGNGLLFTTRSSTARKSPSSLRSQMLTAAEQFVVQNKVSKEDGCTVNAKAMQLQDSEDGNEVIERRGSW